MRHPRSAPAKRKASPQRSPRQLHPTTWPQTSRPPIPPCPVSDFCFCVCILVEFLTTWAPTRRSFGLAVRPRFNFASPVLPQFEQNPLVGTGPSSAVNSFFHTEHVLRPLAGGIPPAQWLRCEGSINEQQIKKHGEGKTTAISQFSSPASSLSGQENRSCERRANGEVGLLLMGGGGG